MAETLAAPARAGTVPAAGTAGDRAESAVIAVRDLVKTYPGGVEAVKGISFAARDGEFFGLLGPNGAGKSTTPRSQKPLREAAL